MHSAAVLFSHKIHYIWVFSTLSFTFITFRPKSHSRQRKALNRLPSTDKKPVTLLLFWHLCTFHALSEKIFHFPFLHTDSNWQIKDELNVIVLSSLRPSKIQTCQKAMLIFFELYTLLWRCSLLRIREFINTFTIIIHFYNNAWVGR